MNNEFQSLFPAMVTKLSPAARWGYNLMERPHLLEQLLTKQPKRLVLINAAAGYGKSTLMAQAHQALHQHRQAAAWLTLDEDDNDPIRLYSYLYLALQTSKSAPPQLPDTARITRSHAARLAGLMTESKSPTTLFIDELECLTNPDALQLILWLMEYLPANCRMVIASRTRPSWDLSKLAMQGELLELQTSDLKLSDQEAAQLVTLHGPAPMDRQQLDTLIQKTEGWLAGVRLALLCQDNWEHNANWIDGLSGEIEQIADFLYEQVFRQLETEQQLFLLKVSILNRMAAPACEALTREPGAQTQLQSLCRKGLFIQPLDPQRKWFRMHGLMRQFLRNRLKQQMPGQYGALNEVAARWFARNNSRVEAVHHAIAANNSELALTILEDVSQSLIEKGQLRTLSDLARRIPDGCLDDHCQLIANLCLANLLIHELASAQQYSKMLETLTSRPETNQTFVENPALEPLLMTARDDMVRAGALARQNISHLAPDQNHFERGVLSNIIAYVELCQGNDEASLRYALQARASHLEAKSSLGLAYADLVAAMSARSRGQLQRAKEIVAAVGFGQDYDQSGSSPPNEIAKGVANGFETDLLYELNELDTAESLLKEYAPLGRENVAPDMVILSFLTSARIAFAKGNTELAYSRLDEGEIAGIRWPLPRLIQSMRLQRVRFAQLEGKVDLAREYLADTNPTPDGTATSKQGYVDRVSELVALDLVPLRQMIMECEPETADRQLDTLMAAPGTRISRQIQLLLLKADCQMYLGKRAEALHTLTDALDQGRTCGYIRIFADAGETIKGLLKHLCQEWATKPAPCFRERRAYCLKLLEAANEVVMHGPADEVTLVEPLSDRELQALTLVGDGLKNEQIAEQLYLSVNTVKWHLRRAYEKLGVRSRTEALAEARRRSLIQ